MTDCTMTPPCWLMLKSMTVDGMFPIFLVSNMTCLKIVTKLHLAAGHCWRIVNLLTYPSCTDCSWFLWHHGFLCSDVYQVLHEHGHRRRKFLIQNSMKVNCSAAVHFKEICTYPEYTVSCFFALFFLHANSWRIKSSKRSDAFVSPPVTLFLRQLRNMTVTVRSCSIGHVQYMIACDISWVAFCGYYHAMHFCANARSFVRPFVRQSVCTVGEFWSANMFKKWTTTHAFF